MCWESCCCCLVFSSCSLVHLVLAITMQKSRWSRRFTTSMLLVRWALITMARYVIEISCIFLEPCSLFAAVPSSVLDCFGTCLLSIILVYLLICPFTHLSNPSLSVSVQLSNHARLGAFCQSLLWKLFGCALWFFFLSFFLVDLDTKSIRISVHNDSMAPLL